MGQRSQIYLRYNGKLVFASYFQWNYGERMISRARWGIEHVKWYSDEKYDFAFRDISYAEYGEWIEDECDNSVRFALNTLRSKIDRDAERYERSVLQKRHAAYSREQKRNGKEPMDFDAWIEVNNTLHH